MKGFHDVRALIRARLDEEIGTIRREAPRRVALVYPSPYHVGMSSLGYQSIYARCQRASTAGPPSAPFSPTTSRRWQRARLPLVTYEGETPVGDCRRHRLLGRLRARADRAVRLPRAGRAARSSPTSATPRIRSSSPAGRSRSPTRCRSAPFVDVVVLGEAEELVVDAARRRRRRARSRARCSTRLARRRRLLGAVASTASGCRRSRRPTTRSCPRARRC